MRETTNDIEWVNSTLSPVEDPYPIQAHFVGGWRKHLPAAMWAYLYDMYYALETLGKRDGAFLSDEGLASEARVSPMTISKARRYLRGAGAIEHGYAVRDGETDPVWFIQILPPPDFLANNPEVSQEGPHARDY